MSIPGPQRVESIADMMESFGMYTQANEVRRLTQYPLDDLQLSAIKSMAERFGYVVIRKDRIRVLKVMRAMADLEGQPATFIDGQTRFTWQEAAAAMGLALLRDGLFKQQERLALYAKQLWLSATVIMPDIDDPVDQAMPQPTPPSRPQQAQMQMESDVLEAA
jgi:hypothetical protein